MLGIKRRSAVKAYLYHKVELKKLLHQKMATAQLQRTSMSELGFPNKISTEQQSLLLVKRLLAISVSCITYLRGIFPECAYGTRYFDDLCVKILREDKNCPGSTQLVKWMLGCYDALQKKYLRMVVLAVYTNPEDPQTISECYQFKFKYTRDGPIMDFISRNQTTESSISSADTKKASILLIRKIYVLMQNLEPLPNDVCLTMKLFYYDEVTPPDYQPPGFKDGDCEGVIFEGEPMYLNVGEVPTPFHTFKVKVTTEKERMENIDSTILFPKQLKTPLQKILMEKDDLEDEQEHYVSDDFDIEMNTEEQKKTTGSSELGEPNVAYEGDKIMRSKESQDLSTSHSQVEQLVNKTSNLDMSESKTRSGKIFQNKVSLSYSKKFSSEEKAFCKTCKILYPKIGNKQHALPVVNGNQRVKSSKENRKRSQLESGKKVLHHFDSASQESVPKRRKFSEPKEHI